jgi:uncharacterized protein YoxC
VQVGEVIFVIALNCIIIFILYTLQQKSLEKRIKHVKKEVQDLEDLVAAIIEEFEEIAENTESRVAEIQNTISEVSPVKGTSLENVREINNNLSLETTEDVIEVITNEDTLQSYNNPTIESTQADKIEVNVEPFQNTGNFRPVSDPKHQRIIQLWEQGVSIEEIAKHLNTGRGEVQLILGIYRRS